MAFCQVHDGKVKLISFEFLGFIAPLVAMSLFAAWLASPKRQLDSILRFLLFVLAAGIFLIIGSLTGAPLKGYEDPISSMIAGVIVVAMAVVAIVWRTLALRRTGRL